MFIHRECNYFAETNYWLVADRFSTIIICVAVNTIDLCNNQKYNLPRVLVIH